MAYLKDLVGKVVLRNKKLPMSACDYNTESENYMPAQAYMSESQAVLVIRADNDSAVVVHNVHRKGQHGRNYQYATIITNKELLDDGWVDVTNSIEALDNYIAENNKPTEPQVILNQIYTCIGELNILADMINNNKKAINVSSSSSTKEDNND